MYRLLVIAKNNIKKQKGEMFVFALIVIISSFLIFSSSMILSGLGNVTGQLFDKINGAHILSFILDEKTEVEAMKNTLEKNKDIEDYESSRVIVGSMNFKHGKESKWAEYQFCMGSFDQKRRIHNVDFGDVNLDEKDMLLPYHMCTNYKIGDTINIKIDDNRYDFRVAGFVEDPYFCSTLNITINSVFISDSMIDKIHGENSLKAKTYQQFCSRVTDDFLRRGDSLEDLESKVVKEYTNEASSKIKPNEAPNYLDYMSVHWEMMKAGATFLPQLALSFIIIFSIIILIVGIIIVVYGVNSFIQRNMKNTGILEAIGYTVKELRMTIVMQMTVTAFLSTVIGVAMGMGFHQQIGDISSLITGLRWNQALDSMLGVYIVAGFVIGIFITSIFISRKYKKISVLEAMKNGISSHNYRKNHFAFDKFRIPMPLSIAMKETFGGKGRTLLLIIITAVLSMSAVVGIGSYITYGTRDKEVMKIVGVEMADVFVEKDDYYDRVNNLECTKSVLRIGRFDSEVEYNGKVKKTQGYRYDDMNKRVNMNLVEGRVATHDNEVVISTGVQDDMGCKVGEVITISHAGKKADYLIVGIDQKTEQMGRTVGITLDGAKRIVSGKIENDMSITLKPGYSFKEAKKMIQSISPDLNISNSRKNMEETLETVKVAIGMICKVILIITAIIVIFVESLIVKNKITKEWRNYGISKALGMKTSDLIVQIMLSNMPAIAFGSIVGILLSSLVGANMFKVAFSIMSFRNVEFCVPNIWKLVTFVAIIVIALGTAGIVGLRLRKLNPIEMISEE
ncbi:ABC transporter permease [Eubacterium xylanophilum]|uniref:ABC transporter permease n=1 Tax=Eubacterium xylanophilum TaxID=39497 RepID=UPI00047DE5E4|nr:FtsX-like permease family protein [Eubacterium xylanophilum]